MIHETSKSAVNRFLSLHSHHMVIGKEMIEKTSLFFRKKHLFEEIIELELVPLT